MKIFVGMDDTDVLGSEVGTGQLARMVMDGLARDHIIGSGVSRHQLLFDRRIPYTAKNSANVIHLLADQVDLPALADHAAAIMQAHYQPGSDPGLCVGYEIPAGIAAFGQRAKQEIVTQEEALALARQYYLILRGLGGTNGGVIGALAGVGLASSGEDGRFTLIGRSRDIRGMASIADILGAGVASVRTVQGEAIAQGEVDCGDKIRPSLRGGQAVLFVEAVNGHWRALRLD